MAVPGFQVFMLPLLKLAADGKEHTLSEAIEFLGNEFKLSEEEKKELLASGSQTKLHNRIAWTRVYLGKAGLLESVGRGVFRITERGRKVIKSAPATINSKYLEQFPEFLSFKNSSNETPASATQSNDEATETPEEALDRSYQALRRQLAQSLLEQVKAAPPAFFEQLVVDLLVSMGYGGSRLDAGQAVGQSGDGGIDGIIKEDKLGLDVVYLQAKRWESTVGRPVVQAFAGSLEGQRARKGVLITTSQFSKDALDYVSRIEKKIVLIDGDRLSDLMIEHGIGVTTIVTYVLQKIDLDYFEGS